MAEIDRIVVLDIERDGSSSTTAEQEMVILRNDLASTDPTKGAGMVGYRSSESYSDETVGKALTDIESNMSAVEDSASQALSKSNEALAKATTAESKIDNALLKGNNLSDLTDKVAALENIGAVPTADIVLDPTAGKTPKAGDDGKIGMNWVRDLEYELSNIQRDIEKIEYPDGIVPFIDWDFTSGQLPSNFVFRRGTEATYFDKFGVLRTAQADEPVFEYDPVTKEALGLRRERESFNKMPYSTYRPGNWLLNASGDCLENYGTAPDGTLTSGFLTVNDQGIQSTPYIYRRYLQYDAGKDYTSSVFLKINPNLDSSKVVRLVLHMEVYGSPNRNVYFVPATGRVYVSPGSEPKNWGFQDCGNGWIRIWMTDTVSEDWGGGTGYSPLIWWSHTLEQGEGVEWWGMQVEEGVSPTSYIPTDGAAKTRLREEIQYQSEGRIYPSNKATVYLDYTPVYSNPSLTGGFALVVGEYGNTFNYLGIDYDNAPSDGRTQSYLRDNEGTGNKGLITYNVKEFGKPFRYACSFSTNQVMHASCNGSEIRTASNDPVMNSYFELCDRVTLSGSTYSSTASVRNSGWFRKVQIYNEVFEDERLISLTAGEKVDISSLDSLTLNQGKNYPCKQMTRNSITSEANSFLKNAILGVSVEGALPDHYYSIAYFKNGSTLTSGRPDGFLISRQSKGDFETADTSIVVIRASETLTPEIPRDGRIHTVVLPSTVQPGLIVSITLDTSKLPPYGEYVSMNSPARPGYSWIIDPSCYKYQQTSQPSNQLNPLSYSMATNNMMSFVWRSGDFLYRLRFGPNGANSLPNVRGIEYAPLAPIQEAAWTIINEAGTDWLPPMVVRAVNNGDSHRMIYTGGNHGADGTSAGGSTARCVLFQWYLDGEPVEMGRIYTGSVQKATAVIVNELMAYNTTGTVDPVAFPARYVLRQTFVVDFVPGSIEVLAHVEALEDIEVKTDNGPQMVSVGFQGEQVFVGSGITRGAFDATQDSGPSSNTPNCWALVLSSEAGQQVSWVDRSYEAGDGRYVSPTAPFIRGGGGTNTKMYQAIVAAKTIPFTTGSSYRWRGGYAWQAPGLVIDSGLDCRIDYLCEGRSHHAFVKPSSEFFVIP